MNLFTLDIDWAPEEVIEDSLQLFEKYNVPCTVFVTHRSKAIDGCNRKNFEIAIHPNYNPLLFEKSQNTFDEITDSILALYPEAKGVRSHSTTQNAFFFQKFKEKGLLYEANLFLPYWNSIKAFKLWNSLVRIPYNWEDDIHYLYNKKYTDCELDTSTENLNVFDFHPIHIYLNTEAESRYIEAKKNYHQPELLRSLRNNVTTGTRDLLISLLEKENYNKARGKKLSEFAITV